MTEHDKDGGEQPMWHLIGFPHIPRRSEQLFFKYFPIRTLVFEKMLFAQVRG
jgi:hypothetical protein